MSTEFVLQIQKQQGDLAILLASSKQQHKEKTQNGNTQQRRLNTQKKSSLTKSLQTSFYSPEGR
jgi:hypothetical protein